MTEEQREAILAILEMVPDERAAIELVERRRWPDGIICPYCKSERTTRQRNYQYHQCKDCRKKFTCRTNSAFERSHIPMRKWLLGIYLFMTTKEGISSIELSKDLGITQKSAWFMLHRLREAIEVDTSMSSGDVEADESGTDSNFKNMQLWKRYFVKRKAKGM